MKAFQKFLAISLICACLSATLSFAATYFSSLSAAKTANEMQVSPEFFEDLAKTSGLTSTDIQQSFQKVQDAQRNPLTYPGFRKYWFQAFFAWLPISAGLILLFTWLRTKAKGGSGNAS